MKQLDEPSIMLATKVLTNGLLCFLAPRDQKDYFDEPRQRFLMEDAVSALDDHLCSISYALRKSDLKSELAVDRSGVRMEEEDDNTLSSRLNAFERASIFQIAAVAASGSGPMGRGYLQLYQGGGSSGESLKDTIGLSTFQRGFGFGNYIRSWKIEKNTTLWDESSQQEDQIRAMINSQGNGGRLTKQGSIYSTNQVLWSIWIPNQVAEFFVTEADELPYFFMMQTPPNAASSEATASATQPNAASTGATASTTPPNDAYVMRYELPKAKATAASTATSSPAAVPTTQPSTATSSPAATSTTQPSSSSADAKTQAADDANSAIIAGRTAKKGGLRHCLYAAKAAQSGNSGNDAALRPGSGIDAILDLTSFAYGGSTPGSGGDGRMRSDSEFEGTYKWNYVNGTNYQGLRTRLALAKTSLEDTLVAPQGYDPTTKVGRPEDLIVYAKDLSTNASAVRKNKPKTTMPQPPRMFNKAKLGEYVLYKKRKGDLKFVNPSFTTGVPLESEQGSRLSAASVMTQWFKDIERDKSEANAWGSATVFAQAVVSLDGKAKTAWLDLTLDRELLSKKDDLPQTDQQANINSATLPAAQPPSPGDSAKRSLKGWDAKPLAQDSAVYGQVRTDQEWCHLIGHGDGGEEEPDNFVSGSKHCNTEQLAIELGQRRVRRNENYPFALEAKITAYLLPNDGAPRSDVRRPADDNAYLDSLNTAVDGCLDADPKGKGANKNLLTVCAGIEAAIQDLKTGRKSSNAIDPAKLLAVTAAKTDRRAPTLTEYQASDDAGKRKALKAIAVRLRTMVAAPYPLANFIRYKIIYQQSASTNGGLDQKTPASNSGASSGPSVATSSAAPSPTYVKVLDHIMDAQRERLDYKEFLIIQEMVKRVCAEADPQGAIDYLATLTAEHVAALAEEAKLSAGAAQRPPQLQSQATTADQKTAMTSATPLTVGSNATRIGRDEDAMDSDEATPSPNNTTDVPSTGNVQTKRSSSAVQWVDPNNKPNQSGKSVKK